MRVPEGGTEHYLPRGLGLSGVFGEVPGPGGMLQHETLSFH